MLFSPTGYVRYREYGLRWFLTRLSKRMLSFRGTYQYFDTTPDWKSQSSWQAHEESNSGCLVWNQTCYHYTIGL